jgi:hypothetical protein
MKKLRLTLLAATVIFTLGCAVRESSVIGTYQGAGDEFLKINSDKTFSYTGRRISRDVTGSWQLAKRRIYFRPDNKADSIWECRSLKRKRQILIGSARCTPTHQFVVFKKLKE